VTYDRLITLKIILAEKVGRDRFQTTDHPDSYILIRRAAKPYSLESSTVLSCS